MTDQNAVDVKDAGPGQEEIIAFLKKLFPRDAWPQIWLVGGIVRDFLLGKACRDIDLATTMPAATLKLLGFRLVEGKSTLPIHFMADPEFGIIEVVTIDAAGGLVEDLLRRDFTCNALALSLNGKLFDPLGSQEDMKNRLLRACSRESFIDDPLRIFRAFRFQTEGWRLVPETEALIRAKSWENELSGIPVERFSREMLKALKGNCPAEFFREMISFDVGRSYLPELFRMPDIPAGPIDKHPEGDLFTHACQVLQRVAAVTTDPLTRFCAFFHDLGKLSTAPELYPRHHGHEDAGFDLAREFCNRLSLSAAHRTALSWICRLHGNAGGWQELRDATKIRMADQARRAGIVRILPLVAAGDKPDGGSMPRWEEAVRVAGMSTLQVGIERSRLEAMPVEKRADFVLQKRIEWFRRE